MSGPHHCTAKLALLTYNSEAM